MYLCLAEILVGKTRVPSVKTTKKAKIHLAPSFPSFPRFYKLYACEWPKRFIIVSDDTRHNKFLFYIFYDLRHSWICFFLLVIWLEILSCWNNDAVKTNHSSSLDQKIFFCLAHFYFLFAIIKTQTFLQWTRIKCVKSFFEYKKILCMKWHILEISPSKKVI